MRLPLKGITGWFGVCVLGVWGCWGSFKGHYRGSFKGSLKRP